ncbi:response regulator [Candidatus Omnitrophota bacterium]
MLNEKDQNKTNDDPMNILLVEDSEDDILITKRAFKHLKIKSKLYIVRDGQEALDFVYHKGSYEDKQQYPIPDLILLDIKMPKVDGFQVLETLKKDLEYMTIPVIMLTSSKNQEDIVRSYRNHAASYIQKPVSYEEFVDVIKVFSFYWHNINKLPYGKGGKS